MALTPPLRGVELFQEVIRVWKRLPDPMAGYTLQQIANLTLGAGTAQNAAVVGRTLAEFGQYFHAPKDAGYKWRVNWTKVNQDHPGLLERTTAPKAPPLDVMAQALTDEIAAVRQEMEANPVIGLWLAPLDLSGDGSFLYEVGIELSGDAELPMPEGVKVLLRWREGVEPPFVEGTLLSYDPPTSRIIVEVARPFTQRHLSRPFQVLSRVDELLAVVKTRLESLKQTPAALSWRLLNQRGAPATTDHSLRLPPLALDRSQTDAVQWALQHDITFLWGPPGTGKTHTLANLIAALAVSGKRVIATSIANVAVDQLARRLVMALEKLGTSGTNLLSSGQILRFGHARLPEVTGEPRLFPNKAEIQRLRKALHEAREAHRLIPQGEVERRALAQKRINDLTKALKDATKVVIENAKVVLTTAVQASMEQALVESQFDVAVVDEASMMPIPYLMCMGAMGKERLVVAGDFRQLGPIAVSKSQAAFEWLHKDGFELVGLKENLAHPALRMLTVQRRMHQDICSCINHYFYADRLTTEVTNNVTAASRLEPLPGSAAAFVVVTPADGSLVETTHAHSRVNRMTAPLVADLARWLAWQDDRAEVAIITPYRGQVAAIKQALRDSGLKLERDSRIKVGTVHAFQGSEADIVIWDVVETRDFRVGRLYQGDSGCRLTNVAVSRAKGKLIIVGDPEAFVQAPGYTMVRQPTSLFARYFPSVGRNTIPVQRLRTLMKASRFL